MIKKILNNQLFKDSFVYVFADVINKAIPFLLLPILTYYLTPADYGILATFNSLVGILGIFIGLSIQGAISVNYYKLNKEELARYIGNVFYILMGSFLMTLLFISLFKNYLVDKLGLEYQWMLVAAIMSLASFIVLINLSLWLVEQKPKNYGIYQIGETIIKFGLSLYFVIMLLLTWKGRVLGMFIGSLISVGVSLYILKRRDYIHFRWHKVYIKDALHFGLPLVPHQLSYWLRSGAIIFLLVFLVGKKETGLYNVGVQFVIPIGVLTAAFNKAWAPYLYRVLSKEPGRKDKLKIVKFTYLYFVGIIVMALSVALFAPYLIDVILEKRFSNAHVYVFYLSLAAAFQGMYYMVVNYIFYEKKTKYLAYITFGTSLINVALAYWLIENNGAVGAAQALLVANILSFLLVWYYSHKVHQMPWGMF